MGRFIATLSLIMLLPACNSWTPAIASPGAIIVQERPKTVRVTMTGGATITFQNPTITNDTIVGFTGTGVGRLSPLDVTHLEIRSFSPVKTSVLMVGHAALVVGFIAAVIKAQPHYRGF